ncbi:MAG: hypothetical protein ACI841_001859 [Planctomycetota bacterium]|jgi:hypothetical protein
MSEELAPEPAMPSLPFIPQTTLDQLIRAGDDTWREYQAGGNARYHHFVPSDHFGAYGHLRGMRAKASTFLELGSGAGVATIIADLLGFDAYGIEIEPWLVEQSIDLAEEFDSSATFAEGTFVVPEYLDEFEHLPSDIVTPTDGADAFEEIGLDFSDFDIVYAYPWPGEEDWLRELVRRHARPEAQLLTYHPDGGFQVRDAK